MYEGTFDETEGFDESREGEENNYESRRIRTSSDGQSEMKDTLRSQ